MYTWKVEKNIQDSTFLYKHMSAHERYFGQVTLEPSGDALMMSVFPEKVQRTLKIMLDPDLTSANNWTSVADEMGKSMCVTKLNFMIF